MLAAIGSITTATRLARLIESDLGARAAVVHTPSSINRGGCSYSIRFKDIYESSVRRLAGEYQIRIKGFYPENHRGHGYHAVP